MSLSLTIQHSPWRADRREAWLDMRRELFVGNGCSHWLHLQNKDYRGLDWETEGKIRFCLDTWEPALDSRCSHHLFMTDDLNLCPGFLGIVEKLIEAVPDKPIGLLSNTPAAPALFAAGNAWYRTNSWLVGPAYILPNSILEGFLAWYETLSDTPGGPESKVYWNDDSAINEWVTKLGPGESWHPLPTPIEHRIDIASTQRGSSEEYSRERCSWRAIRTVRHSGADSFEWLSEPHILPGAAILSAMNRGSYWQNTANTPMVRLPNG